MKRVASDGFFLAYDRWQADCLREFNERYGSFFGARKYYDWRETGASDPEKVVEFSDAGGAYPHSRFGIDYIPNAVTPWRESPHFVDG